MHRKLSVFLCSLVLICGLMTILPSMGKLFGTTEVKGQTVQPSDTQPAVVLPTDPATAAAIASLQKKTNDVATQVEQVASAVQQVSAAVTAVPTPISPWAGIVSFIAGLIGLIAHAFQSGKQKSD